MSGLLIVTTASRDWPVESNNVIFTALEFCVAAAFERGGKLTVRVGDARGGDRVIHDWTERMHGRGWAVEKPIKYVADWRGPCSAGRCGRTHRRSDNSGGTICPLAGYRRNELMIADEPAPDLLLAFIHHESRGATHCLGVAKAAGVDVQEFRL